MQDQSTDPNPTYERFQAQWLGLFDTLIIFIGYAESEEEFSRYADIVFDRLETLHRYYDIYNAYENVNNLYTINANAGIEPVQVGDEIISLLLRSKEAYNLTYGITNIAMGPVLRIWHEYRAQGLANPQNAALPPMDSLLLAGDFAGISGIVIDTEKSTVFLAESGMSIDVGSIAKGYAAQQAIQAAIEAGAANVLLSAGGHIVTRGIPYGRDLWNVGIQNPDRTHGAPAVIDSILMTNATVSISGGYLRYYEVDGQFFGHIIDPATLLPAYRYQMVAAYHPVSWMADIVSTALFILPIEEGKELAAKTGSQALWMDFDGNFVATQGYIEKSTIINWDEENH